MANPAPTINQINAFNATQGTTIDFNIIGGTELVRSNRIYIYDLSDNSLICTHLYVSTESIHELPANTDSSIVYESGKSSADFVNGAQYYAQIQTFTDIAGTEGGSGLSVAKMFWCLVDPTLTITTIPSTISTTSYNVSATYNANTSVVSNIIQQYQFSLYSATGSLLQSSGVVVGNGEQQGTSTAYDISYNFSGLSVGSSYYVTVEVTTTQGMSINTQSNTFTVSIDTPTLGEATVVNNACDGYISVTSNLSGEYGGSGSGEIVSFETDSENVFTKLQVDLDPIQDLHGYDAPWVGGAGKNKWNGTFVNTTFAELGSFASPCYAGNNAMPIKVGAVYSTSMNGTLSGIRYVFLDADKNAIGDFVNANSTVPAPTNAVYLRWRIRDEATASGLYQIEEGSTATSWTPYENICPISGWDSVGVVDVGTNQFDEDNADFATGIIKDDGTIGSNYTGYEYAQSYTPVHPSTTYCVIGSAWMSGVYNYIAYYDASKTFISRYGIVADISTARTFTTPSNCYYIRAVRAKSTWTDYCINYPSTDTDYHAYNGTTHTTTLPETVYGGTLDLVSGVLTVTHELLNFPTSGWANQDTLTNTRRFSVNLTNMLNVGANNVADILCSQYQTKADASDTVHVTHRNNALHIFVDKNTFAGIQAWETYLQGLTTLPQVWYPLATPQTYQLTPQQIQTLVGVNNVWSEQGNVELSYHIPITNLLVKRQDVDDVSGDWLTLYSQPITQASDMNFTFIDFTNQYGKTYKYALVPLLTQQQSGVEVEVEGGYTVSDEVQSIFDGVFIADSTGSQKCKANVGYGNVDMNQVVGSITPIGAKYPIVITNSQNQYHNGSISGTIVPDDYYFNGNLSRIDMVNKRDELEQFLTNKRAKIIKDWNGKIWLVMIMDNVSCTFNNNYGMGIVNFSTSWVEVGDPTNQQDLQATGLIDVGGV